MKSFTWQRNTAHGGDATVAQIWKTSKWSWLWRYLFDTSLSYVCEFRFLQARTIQDNVLANGRVIGVIPVNRN